ncbi:hypothetical protein [Sphingomonas sp.]|uniref:hypothetical protein n=1 Tax=Sphingomonas sp. TaxID=28214 RepID=UPI003B3B9DA8
MQISSTIALLILPVLASACSPAETPVPQDADGNQVAGAAVEPAERTAPVVNEATGGDPITLDPLTGDEAALEGELRCAFANPAGETLLIAAADVDPAGRASAMMRANGTVERLVGRTEGGFDALAKGASLGTRGLTVEIVRGTAIPTGNEGSRHRATIRIDRADGGRRTYEGFWTCGP